MEIPSAYKCIDFCISFFTGFFSLLPISPIIKKQCRQDGSLNGLKQEKNLLLMDCHTVPTGGIGPWVDRSVKVSTGTPYAGMPACTIFLRKAEKGQKFIKKLF